MIKICFFIEGMTNTKAREMLDSGYRMPAPEGTPDEMYNFMLKCCNYVALAKWILQNLWQGMYLRWIVDPSPQREAHKKMGEIIQRNRDARARVMHLRRKLQELENQADKMGLLKQ